MLARADLRLQVHMIMLLLVLAIWNELNTLCTCCDIYNGSECCNQSAISDQPVFDQL